MKSPFYTNVISKTYQCLRNRTVVYAYRYRCFVQSGEAKIGLLHLFNRYYLLIALVMSIPLTGISQSKKATTTIKGSIQNQQKDFFLLRMLGRADSVKLGADGSFELKIEQATANYFTLEHGKQTVTLYLFPSDDVSLKLNGSNMTDVKEVTGKSATYCNYLIDKQKADKNLHYQFPPHQLQGMTGEFYYEMRDSVRTSRESQLLNESRANRFTESFKSAEKKSYGYQMGYELLNYKSNAAKSGITQFPAHIDHYLQSQNLNDEEMTYDFYFRAFALNYMAQEAAIRYYAGKDKSVLRFYELEMDIICEKISSEKNKSVCISEIMPQLINDVGIMDLTMIVTKLDTCLKDAKLLAAIKKAAVQYEYLHAGKLAPQAYFHDVVGNISRISDYHGKVIYIDAWATWCGPCKREIPYLISLEQEYRGKNIQFISVSTDKDINAWRSFIEKEEMSGLQLRQSENFEESLSKAFVINSIPRFIIIDAAGKIVSADAPRPSSGDQIRDLLNSLLAD